ncbi:MAG: CpsB/CapC family capsule biosynthesis tyrosine phosphatase [Eubacterium ramulus]
MTGYWDVHNHILPGVDDGSSCMRETMSLLQAEYEQGIRHLIVTPHYRRGMFEIGFEDIQKVYEKTRLYCEETFPSMHLYLGRECFVSSVNRAEKILSDSRYYMAGRPVVLLEFGYETEYAMIFQTVLMAQEAQVIPVLAHIERYRALQNQDAVRRIRKAGASVQINCESILGKTGFRTKHFCQKLLKEKLVDLIASNAHNTDQRQVHMRESMTLVEKKYGSAEVERIFAQNPESLFYIEEKGA